MAYKPFQMPVDIYDHLARLRDARKGQQDRVTLVSVLREELNMPDPKQAEAQQAQPEQVHP